MQSFKGTPKFTNKKIVSAVFIYVAEFVFVFNRINLFQVMVATIKLRNH